MASITMMDMIGLIKNTTTRYEKNSGISKTMISAICSLKGF